MTHADQALYAAKRNGKNQAMQYDRAQQTPTKAPTAAALKPAS